MPKNFNKENTIMQMTTNLIAAVPPAIASTGDVTQEGTSHRERNILCKKHSSTQ